MKKYFVKLTKKMTKTNQMEIKNGAHLKEKMKIKIKIKFLKLLFKKSNRQINNRKFTEGWQHKLVLLIRCEICKELIIIVRKILILIKMKSEIGVSCLASLLKKKRINLENSEM